MVPIILQLSNSDYIAIGGIVAVLITPILTTIIHAVLQISKIKADIIWIKRKLGYNGDD